MVDEHPGHDPGPEPRPADVASGHELSDASIPGLVVFLIGLTVSLVVVVFAIAWLFDIFVDRSARRDPPASPLAELRSSQPPSPRLQQAPALDMRVVRGEQVQRLTKARWIDKPGGVVQMPIDQAMKRIAEETSQPPGGTDLPTTERTSQGLPKWPAVQTGKGEAGGKAKPTDGKEPPGSGKNADSTSHESVPDKQPSDVSEGPARDSKVEDQK
jgi:hypothetical protein